MNKSAFEEGVIINHYCILSRLGAGGMGEVYRAKDARLNREVAIKILPADFAKDADRLRRFESEARAVGALNHPNILTVHDFGLYEGIPYLVMELLEGDELRSQLDAGALPVRKTIDYAQQIANGLTAAHSKNIVHRDLKPANVFVTSDGRVKILDFGLAKLRQPRRGEDDSTLSLPSERKDHTPNTDPGTVMGTVGYMAPEQVRGEAVDQRADIFSFGVMLYEMLSGQRPFTGTSHVEVMHAILKDEPPELSETNAKIAPQLDKIVRHCLEKKPERRFQTASDLGFALEALAAPSSGSASNALPNETVNVSVPSVWRARSGWVVAAALLLSTLAFAVAYFRRTPASTEANRFSIEPPEQTMMEHLCLSPDGRTLAFTAVGGGKTRLYLRPLALMTAQALPGTEEAQFPFWSPDGHALGFFARGKLKRIGVDGKNLQPLCDAVNGRGGDWNREGSILFAAAGLGGISRISTAGGEVTLVTRTDHFDGGNGHKFPRFLPDGHHFLYTDASPLRGQSGIFLASLDGGEPKRLAIQGNSQCIYVAPGYLLYGGTGGLMAQAFDARRQELTGEPVRLAEQLMQDTIGAYGRFSASDQGTLIYDANPHNQKRLAWFDRNGKVQAVPGSVGAYIAPSLSPDEKRVAVQRRGGDRSSDLWVRDLVQGAEQRFTFDPYSDLLPVWSPDGSRIVWTSNRGRTPAERVGSANLYIKAAGGGGQDEVLFASNSDKWATAWSADGKYIGFHQRDQSGLRDLFYLPLSDKEHPVALLQTPADEFNLRFSPDGKWYAYSSNEYGNYEVFVQSFPPAAQAGGGKWQISTGGGSTQLWRRDGKELYFISAERKLMTVEVKAGPGFAYGAPKLLFDFPGEVAEGDLYNYTVSADGQKFLIVVNDEATTAKPLTVVLNWMAEIKK